MQAFKKCSSFVYPNYFIRKIHDSKKFLSSAEEKDTDDDKINNKTQDSKESNETCQPSKTCKLLEKTESENKKAPDSGIPADKFCKPSPTCKLIEAPKEETESNKTEKKPFVYSSEVLGYDVMKHGAHMFKLDCKWASNPYQDGKYFHHMMYTRMTFYDIIEYLQPCRSPQPSVFNPIKPAPIKPPPKPAAPATKK